MPFRRLLLAFALLLLAVDDAAAQTLRHYVFFNRDRAAAREPGFLKNKAFEGAQIKYTWRELEPAKGKYDFSAIREDLALLSANGKKLFVQLQDVSFHESIVNVPEYLRREPRYGGGVHRDVIDEERGTRGGWVARRWDPAVRERFQRLLRAMGRELDGRIEGINLPETAISFGDSGKLHPPGYSYDAYLGGVLANMTALRRAFPRSVVMIYANFMPGDWQPGRERKNLTRVYEHARALGIAAGNPDLLPHHRPQMRHGYGLMRDAARDVVAGVAVQEGNYAFTNPATGRRVTVEELVAFARDHLQADYLFWFPEEPYFTRDVLPYLAQ